MSAQGEQEARGSNQQETRTLCAMGDGGEEAPLTFLVEPEHGGAKPHRPRSAQEPIHRRSGGLWRAEPPAAAERVLALEEDEGDARRPQHLGRGQSRRATSGDGYLRLELLGGRPQRRHLVGQQAQPGQVAGDFCHDPVSDGDAGKHGMVVEASWKEPVDGGEDVHLGRRVAVLPLEPHPPSRRDAAGEEVGRAVHPHQALRAGGGQAEWTARAVVLHAAGEDALSRCQEGHRHRLTLLSRHGLPFEVERDGAFSGDGDEAAHGGRALPLLRQGVRAWGGEKH